MDLSIKSSRGVDKIIKPILDNERLVKIEVENNNQVFLDPVSIKTDYDRKQQNDINMNEISPTKVNHEPLDYSTPASKKKCSRRKNTSNKKIGQTSIDKIIENSLNLLNNNKTNDVIKVEKTVEENVTSDKCCPAKRTKVNSTEPSVPASHPEIKQEASIAPEPSSNSSGCVDLVEDAEGDASVPGSVSTEEEWSRYWCRVCDKQFRSNIGLQRHEIEVHLKTMVECDGCTKMFRSDSALNDHKKRVHGPRQYACGLCNADFTSEAYLRAHAKVHAEKKHICPECNHSFVNKTDLNNHMRVHNGDKPYPCNICGKRFRHVSGFYTHVRIHTGETPYQCDFCEKMFTNASNYQTHRKIHTREKKFKCEECGKEFIQQSNFSRHMRIHTKERPYGCRECEAKFTYSTALKRHEEREHGIQPHPCEKCGRTFLNQTSLIRHRTGCQLKDCVKAMAQEGSSQFL